MQIRVTDKDHWFDMSYPFSPIPTDPVVLNMPVVPLADKMVYYAIGRRILFFSFSVKFFVDVLKSSQRIFSLEHLIKNFLYVIILLSLSLEVGRK